MQVHLNVEVLVDEAVVEVVNLLQINLDQVVDREISVLVVGVQDVPHQELYEFGAVQHKKVGVVEHQGVEDLVNGVLVILAQVALQVVLREVGVERRYGLDLVVEFGQLVAERDGFVLQLLVLLLYLDLLVINLFQLLEVVLQVFQQQVPLVQVVHKKILVGQKRVLVLLVHLYQVLLQLVLVLVAYHNLLLGVFHYILNLILIKSNYEFLALHVIALQLPVPSYLEFEADVSLGLAGGGEEGFVGSVQHGGADYLPGPVGRRGGLDALQGVLPPPPYLPHP